MIANLIGATGLVGSKILEKLLSNDRIHEVRSFGRRNSNRSHAKLTEYIVDFNEIPIWENLLQGELLFSALGTTRSEAGSKSAQYKVDYSYQLHVAQAARANGVHTYSLISSANASSSSLFFYPRMKGALENEIKALEFMRTRILRPGPLEGDRREPRASEEIFLKIAHSLPQVLLPTVVQPVKDETVARAAVESSLDKVDGLLILEPKDIFSY